MLAVGLGGFEKAIDSEIDAVAQGGAGFKAGRGEYGSGKTFFARWLAECAKRRGFAAAEVQISENREVRARRDLRRARTTDIRGHPVPGAEVHFSTMQGAVSAPTGDGRFELEGAPETYTLTARKAGHAPATLNLQAMRSRDRQAIELVLEPGHLVTGKVVARA